MSPPAGQITTRVRGFQHQPVAGLDGIIYPRKEISAVSPSREQHLLAAQSPVAQMGPDINFFVFPIETYFHSSFAEPLSRVLW